MFFLYIKRLGKFIIDSLGAEGGFDTLPAPKLRILFLNSYDTGETKKLFLKRFRSRQFFECR